jgi:hypothetical protein
MITTILASTIGLLVFILLTYEPGGEARKTKNIYDFLILVNIAVLLFFLFDKTTAIVFVIATIFLIFYVFYFILLGLLAVVLIVMVSIDKLRDDLEGVLYKNIVVKVVTYPVLLVIDIFLMTLVLITIISAIVLSTHDKIR